MKEHGSLKIEAARFFAAHILNGLDYLRKSRVVHRDLKPDNIVLNEEWIPQLADFGSSKCYTEDGQSVTTQSANTVSDITSQCTTFYNQSQSDISGLSAEIAENSNQVEGDLSEDSSEEDEDILGTAAYVSPEMIQTQDCSYEADLWAFGVILYQMITGDLPFKGKTQEATFDLIKKGEYKQPECDSDDATDLI